ncbi:ead/Ea22-like family protein [Escherichia coli]|nr:ead/Ea22-like family protein [Escherichia coli]
MSEIDYQALREKAEKATCGEWSLEYGEGRFDGDDALIHREVAGYIPICRIEGAHPESGFDEDFQMEQQANAEFIAAANPATVLALLDELEGKDSKIANLTAERDALREGEMGDARYSNTRAAADIYFQLVEECEIPAGGSLVEYVDDMRENLEAAEKRIAELEKSEEQLINERDHAESALADMYFAATGDRPEWSNWFGFSDAVDAVVDRIADLEAKQPSPVVPEGLIKAVRFYEQVKRENPPVETGAWKDAVDWVLKEACQAVNIGIKGE